MKRQAATLVAEARIRLGNQLREWSAGLPRLIRPWRNDAVFSALMKQLERHTIVDQVRCFMIYQFAKRSARLPGDVAEVGVYKGGTARLLAKLFEPSGKAIHVFDTFSGLPAPDPQKDVMQEGDFADTSLQEVNRYLRDCRNVRLYPGIFPSTAQLMKETTFCFIHIDVDLYRSVMDCCQFFYPRLEQGGVMIFDDYGFRSCPGAKQAVDDFFSGEQEQPCYLPSGQALVIRAGPPKAGA